jgi:hypothetical protein
LLAASLFVAGCGGGGKASGHSTTGVSTLTTTNPTGTARTTFHYSDEVTQNYMRSCTQSPNATPAYCRCTLDKLSENVSMKDFQRIGLSGGKIPARVRNYIVQAARGCRSKL